MQRPLKNLSDSYHKYPHQTNTYQSKPSQAHNRSTSIPFHQTFSQKSKAPLINIDLPSTTTHPNFTFIDQPVTLSNISPKKRANHTFSKYNSTSFDSYKYSDYKRQAILAEKRRETRLKAIVRIQKCFRRFLGRIRAKRHQIMILNKWQDICDTIWFQYKRHILNSMKATAREISYHMSVKGFLHKWAIKIQRAYRFYKGLKYYRMIHNAYSEHDHDLLKKFIYGYKARKIMQMKEIMIHKHQIKDLQRQIKNWENEQGDYYSDLLISSKKDLRRKKIKLMNTFYKYYCSDDWSWVFHKKGRQTKVK